MNSIPPLERMSSEKFAKEIKGVMGKFLGKLKMNNRDKVYFPSCGYTWDWDTIGVLIVGRDSSSE